MCFIVEAKSLWAARRVRDPSFRIESPFVNVQTSRRLSTNAIGGPLWCAKTVQGYYRPDLPSWTLIRGLSAHSIKIGTSFQLLCTGKKHRRGLLTYYVAFSMAVNAALTSKNRHACYLGPVSKTNNNQGASKLSPLLNIHICRSWLTRLYGMQRALWYDSIVFL
jgi:hypothetical protein